MLKLARYVTKTLAGHRTRSLLTIAGTAVAILVFSLVGAIGEGFARLGRSEGARQRLVVFQANRFCPATSHLPEHYGAAIARLPGVADVAPIQVFTNNCRASLDVIVFHGLPEDKLASARRLRLIEGDWPRFHARGDAALVGRSVAARRGLKVGQGFSIGKLEVTVAGVFAAEQPAEENLIYTRLGFLQRAPGLHGVGTVTQFEVLLADGANPQAVCEAIDARFRSGPVPTDTRPQGEFLVSTLADLAELVGMIQYVGYACLGLVLALVGTTTLMAVQDRVQEHALLEVLGFAPRRVFLLVITESLLLSLAGGLIGASLALAVLHWGQFALGAEAVTIAIRPSWSQAALGVGVSAAAGVLAGLLPAWHAARVNVVAALRPL